MSSSTSTGGVAAGKSKPATTGHFASALSSSSETFVVELASWEDIVGELLERTRGVSADQAKAARAGGVQALTVLLPLLCNALNTEGPIGNQGDDTIADAELALALAFGLLSRLATMPSTSATSLGEIVASTCSGLTSSNERSEIRCRVLSSLFDALPQTSPSRYVVFRSLIEYAGRVGAAGKTVEIDSHPDRIAALCASWSRADGTAALLASVADALEKNKPVQAQQARVAYLGLAHATGAPLDVARARLAVVNAIRDPVSNKEFGVLHLASVAQLKTSSVKEDAALHRLLEIVCLSGDTPLADFEAFEKANPEPFFTSLGLDKSRIVDDMRMVALSALGSKDQEAHTYAEIAAALHIDKDHVERWIVRAVGKGVADCKMDQLNKTVVIQRTSHRAFSDKQWPELGSQLKKWRASVRSVLHTVQAQREQQFGAQAAEVN